ncbi:uncharacterized protein [Arachis hypogaea]|uniref:uncharacterized protein n=1 Tax=Arachis hypogaea TaxID=3818 RepID=UPI000DEC5F37|nr:uncharacterized protein LOC112701413 [Arachis hypogaea]
MSLPPSNNTNTNQASSSSNLPFQPLRNPKGGFNTITLRSGTTLEEIPPRAMEDIHEEEVVVEVSHEDDEGDTKQEEEEEVSLKEPKRKAIMDESIPIPFPSMVKKAKKTLEFDLNMLQVFKKVEVTIPLLDAIQQIPKYAKFFKDLCTHKDRIGELETLLLGSSNSSLMKSISEKCSDPRPCLISCWIGGVAFYDCMCDLGACVSIMPLSIFARLNLAPLKRLAAKFVLADKSVIAVVGIAEDVLVTIKDLVFLVDFYILEMPSTDNESSSSILLGRPFLKTFKFKLDAFTGTYSFEVGDKTIKFNLEESMRHPPKEHSVFRRDEADEDEFHDLGEKEPQLEAKNELKPLTSHLKYAFLEDNQRFPVIITSELSSQEEKKLLEVLRKHKKAIGWSLADIVGIDPRMCMHRIFLQEGARPVRQPQRRLNPTILDVVKKEVARLLDAGIIYLISDSEWVSPIQVVPKKPGITAIKKDDGPAKVDVITSLPRPSSVREVRSFLGHARFYRRLIKNFSKIALPLSRWLQKDVDFEFDSACVEAFEELRRALTTAPIVRGPDWTQPFKIMCDSSNHAVGAALAQRDGKLPYIIAYSSKTLDAAQSNYTTTEKSF